ncbi:MAG TPA: hypothetical protein VMW47_12285 [Verrucomicrobiae bacterium]|nr:hypothetical protein [Verrucomicrobiae bacterium]
MNWSKDHLQGDQISASEIHADISADRGAGANTVAIDVPYDPASSYVPPVTPGYEEAWIRAARQLRLHVWFRSHWNSWEGDYNFAKATPATDPGRQLGRAASVLDGRDTTSYLALTYHWILDHRSYFRSGDIFTPAAEPENAGIAHVDCGTPPCMFASVAVFNQWLQDSMTVDRAAFSQLHLDVRVGYWGTSGWLAANSVLSKATIFDMGVLDVDDYLQSPAALVANLTRIEGIYHVPLVVGEWGDIWSHGDQRPMVSEIRAVMSAVARLPYVIGFNYWRDTGGQESIVNAITLQLTSAGREVAHWFRMMSPVAPAPGRNLAPNPPSP